MFPGNMRTSRSRASHAWSSVLPVSLCAGVHRKSVNANRPIANPSLKAVFMALILHEWFQNGQISSRNILLNTRIGWVHQDLASTVWNLNGLALLHILLRQTPLSFLIK